MAVTRMDKEIFRRETTYQMTMNVLRRMLHAGLITQEEYKRAKALMEAKYQPVIGDISADLA